jgi:hypothetical protein
MPGDTIRCAECGLESNIDIRAGNIESFAVPEAEMRRKCKLANKPSFNLSCPHFLEAINAFVQRNVIKG